VPSGSNYIGQPFAGNIIPADRINPIAKKILDYYSLPKNPGLNGNITDSTLPETADYYSYTGRVDQNITKNNRMFARYSWYNRDSIYNEYTSFPESSGTWFQFQSWQFVVDDVHVVNPTTVLNFRYGYNRFDRNSGQQEEARNFDLTRLGFPSQYNALVPEINRYFPRLDFDGTTMIDVAFGNDFRPVTSHSFVGTMNKSWGAHALKGGAEIRVYGERSRSTGNDQSGRYQFTNAYTRQNSASGTDYSGLQNYAAFLLGLPSTTSITRAATYDEYSVTSGFFVQDDWRVSDRLTLNLGLRYELESPMVERDAKSVSGFDYDYVQPIQTQVQANYASLNDPIKALVPQLNVKGGLKFVGVDDDQLYETPNNTFLPRAGFAYQLDSQTVIRGGVGLFAGFLGQRRGDVIPNGWSLTTTIPTTFNANGAPIPIYWDNALLATPILEPVGNASGRQTGLGTSVTFFNPNPAISKQLRWQFGVQRQLPGNWTAEAVYVGNHGYDIEIVRNINALPAVYLNTDNSRTAAMTANNTFLSGSVANPFAGLLPGTGFNNPTIARRQLMRPYAEFGDINTTNNDGKTWYSSAQLSLNKRYAKGYTFGVSYTWSHWEQATEYLNAADAEPTRMISDLDVTHRLSISAIYELPFGRGKPYMSDAGTAAEAIFGGWQIQGVYTYQSGFPIGFGTDGFYNGTDLEDGSDIALDDKSTLKWINTDVFTSLLNSTSTNATPVDHLRSLPFRFQDVRRDAINNVDLSLLKSFALPGTMELQVRFEFINAFNEPYFPGPVTGMTSATFGQVTASNQDNYARRAQVGVKLIF
jgi:hypothetical protein